MLSLSNKKLLKNESTRPVFFAQWTCSNMTESIFIVDLTAICQLIITIITIIMRCATNIIAIIIIHHAIIAIIMQSIQYSSNHYAINIPWLGITEAANSDAKWRAHNYCYIYYFLNGRTGIFINNLDNFEHLIYN